MLCYKGPRLLGRICLRSVHPSVPQKTSQTAPQTRLRRAPRRTPPAAPKPGPKEACEDTKKTPKRSPLPRSPWPRVRSTRLGQAQTGTDKHRPCQDPSSYIEAVPGPCAQRGIELSSSSLDCNSQRTVNVQSTHSQRTVNVRRNMLNTAHFDKGRAIKKIFL